SVKVIRHENIAVDPNNRELRRDFLSPSLHHPPRITQLHAAVDNIAKQTGLSLRTDGYEIRACLSIIV
ncbi:MAG TPA: hypothetical protein VM118_11810, partial [Acidobacteriota bacterium]|nr:hypothetical protein [Acidobacteriota bacterium]